MPIKHHTQAVTPGKIPWETYNEDHDYSNLDSSTLDVSTKYDIIDEAREGMGSGATQRFPVPVSLPQNMLMLWDPCNGEIPEGYQKVSELAETNFIVIKFNGGENITDCIIRVFCSLPTDTSVEIGDDTLERYVYSESGDGTQKVQTFVVQKGSVLSLTIYNNSGTDRYLGFEYESAEDGREHAQGASSIPTSNANQFKFVADQSGDLRIWQD